MALRFVTVQSQGEILRVFNATDDFSIVSALLNRDSIAYVDEDGDVCRVTNDAEWRTAVHFALKKSEDGVLELHDAPAPPAHAPPSVTAAAAPKVRFPSTLASEHFAHVTRVVPLPRLMGGDSPPPPLPADRLAAVCDIMDRHGFDVVFWGDDLVQELRDLGLFEDGKLLLLALGVMVIPPWLTKKLRKCAPAKLPIVCGKFAYGVSVKRGKLEKKMLKRDAKQTLKEARRDAKKAKKARKRAVDSSEDSSSSESDDEQDDDVAFAATAVQAMELGGVGDDAAMNSSSSESLSDGEIERRVGQHRVAFEQQAAEKRAAIASLKSKLHAEKRELDDLRLGLRQQVAALRGKKDKKAAKKAAKLAKKQAKKLQKIA